MLNKGDTCYVRYKGKIIKVNYMWPAAIFENSHWVHSDAFGSIFAKNRQLDAYDCRFVVMPGMRKEYVESINN